MQDENIVSETEPKADETAEQAVEVAETAEPQSEPKSEIQSEPKKKRKRPAPFKELSTVEKVLRIVVFCLAGALFACCFSMAVYYAAAVPGSDRIIPAFLMAGASLIPFVLELIFRMRISSMLLIVLYIFMFFAGFFGVTISWWKFFPNYYMVLHAIFGYVGSVIGLWLFVKTGNHKGMNTFGLVLAIFAFSMTCEACWEIMEFFNDNVLGGAAQGPLYEVVVGGTTLFVRDVSDTMWDIIMNFIGAAVFAVHFLLHRLTKRDLLIGYMIKDFEK